MSASNAANPSSKGIFGPRHRIWSLPMIGGGMWLAARLGISQDSVDLARASLESSAAAGVGLLVSFMANVIQDNARRKMAIVSANADRIRKLELTHTHVEEVRAELICLKQALTDFIQSKQTDTRKIRNSIVDLNNDIARLKDQDPSNELRPQLEAIARKFGELAGVRQVVKTLSSKVRKVESLAAQVYEVEGRIKHKDADQVPEGWKNWYSRVQREIEAVHSVIDSQVTTKVKSEVSRMLATWRAQDADADSPIQATDAISTVALSVEEEALASGSQDPSEADTAIRTRSGSLLTAGKARSQISRMSKRLMGIESQVRLLSDVVGDLGQRLYDDVEEVAESTLTAEAEAAEVIETPVMEVVAALDESNGDYRQADPSDVIPPEEEVAALPVAAQTSELEEENASEWDVVGNLVAYNLAMRAPSGRVDILPELQEVA